MEPMLVFVLQLGWFIGVWSAVAVLVVWPWSLRLPPPHRLSLWMAPQMFRVLGLGLLVPNLSPGISPEFARATAIGDSITATLALLAFINLRRGSPIGRALAWACTIVGIGDLLIAFPHAAMTGASAHLAAQWYVPVFAGPIMVVSHVAGLVTLLRTTS